MATLAKSQNVCTGCRSRKKKCDGGRPSCASCAKRGELCFYAGAPSQAISIAGQGWISPPGLEADGVPNEWFGSSLNGVDTQTSWYPEPGVHNWQAYNSSSNILPAIPSTPSPPLYCGSTPSSSSSSHGSPATLPPHDRLTELAEMFFEKFYQFLPIIHKPSFMSKILTDGYKECPLLVFSVIAVSASAHPDRQIQQSQRIWYEEAKALFHKAVQGPDHPLQTLQASALVIFQSMLLTDYSTSWMTLGEAWRKAIAIGCNLQDGAPRSLMITLGNPMLAQWYEKEECRRVLWALFILDRGVCFPIGLTHAVDDRQLRLHLPMSEDDFQSTEEPSGTDGIPYTPKIDQLITSFQERVRKKTNTVLQCIVLAYILLGRICECIHSIDYDVEDQTPVLAELTSYLLRMRLIIPHSATDLSGADYRDFAHVVWLNAILNLCTILLYHRPLPEGMSLEDHSDLSSNWPHCVTAARNTVSMIRDAARTTSGIVINPHLSSALFICGRILILEYRCPSLSRKTKDAAIRDDLEIILFSIERMKEALRAVGKKFYAGLAYHLQEDEEQVRRSKACGARDLARRCAQWPANDDDTITIEW